MRERIVVLIFLSVGTQRTDTVMWTKKKTVRQTLFTGFEKVLGKLKMANSRFSKIRKIDILKYTTLYDPVLYISRPIAN